MGKSVHGWTGWCVSAGVKLCGWGVSMCMCVNMQVCVCMCVVDLCLYVCVSMCRYVCMNLSK